MLICGGLMREILDEKVVMLFYIEELENNNIDFLVHREEQSNMVKNYLEQLIQASSINDKIQVASKLWKVLFEAAMSYIDEDKQGYDKLFKFFDEFVQFDELIFASDSFYRDHTLHCLWVYFLGEYVYRKEEYSQLFQDSREQLPMISALEELIVRLNLSKDKTVKDLLMTIRLFKEMQKYETAGRCIAALTHDLGYPLKKIEKINKSMKNILPYFSINSYDDFSFEFNNTQQHFIEAFLEFISCELYATIHTTEEASFLIEEIFKLENGKVVGLWEDAVEKMTEERINILKESFTGSSTLKKNQQRLMSYSHDFEEYKHGIMSAFLLTKNLQAFKNMNYVTEQSVSEQSVDMALFCVKQQILLSITDHTCDSFKITSIIEENYLTLIDELEEFSRISRASQNREYVEEFCSTKLYYEEDWFCIDFIFDNNALDNLNPEIAFKGRCKKFLTLFNISHLSPNLKIKLRCISELEENNHIYTLLISRKYADILIDDISQNIPKYLKLSQFYTKEEYERM